MGSEAKIEDMSEFLNEPVVATLATYSSNGKVRLSPVWYEWEDGGFNVTIDKDDVKVRHLNRDNEPLSSSTATTLHTRVWKSEPKSSLPLTERPKLSLGWPIGTSTQAGPNDSSHRPVGTRSSSDSNPENSDIGTSRTTSHTHQRHLRTQACGDGLDYWFLVFDLLNKTKTTKKTGNPIVRAITTWFDTDAPFNSQHLPSFERRQ